jgi:hypothetical protein
VAAAPPPPSRVVEGCVAQVFDSTGGVDCKWVVRI